MLNFLSEIYDFHNSPARTEYNTKGLIVSMFSLLTDCSLPVQCSQFKF